MNGPPWETAVMRTHLGHCPSTTSSRADAVPKRHYFVNPAFCGISTQNEPLSCLRMRALFGFEKSANRPYFADRKRTQLAVYRVWWPRWHLWASSPVGWSLTSHEPVVASLRGYRAWGVLGRAGRWHRWATAGCLAFGRCAECPAVPQS